MEIRYRHATRVPALVLAVWLCACRETQDAKTRAPAAAPAIPTSPVTAFVDRYAESGLEVKDSVSGDLNKDSLPDLILLFSGRKPPPNPAADTLEPRPLVILVGAGKGLFRQASVNWNAVLCGTCGNRLSDPYAKIVIKDGFFSLEHAASDTAVGWKRVTTFKYADSLDTWILNRDGIISWKVEAGGKKPSEYHVIRTRKDFGNIPIDSFDIYALDDHYQGIDDDKGFPLSFGHTPSYLGWHRVKSGIWHILDYCTDNLSQGYMFFAKVGGKAYESDSESEMEVVYSLVKNVVAEDTCRGFAIRHEPSIRPGKARKAQYDSAANIYHLGSDTVRFTHEKLPSDPNWNLFVFKRGQDTLVLSSDFAEQGGCAILYTGDINADGYLDFIRERTSISVSTALYLSKKGSDGRVRMEVAGGKTFTE